eukprot:748122-Hanusia_phi.AAC.4
MLLIPEPSSNAVPPLSVRALYKVLEQPGPASLLLIHPHVSRIAGCLPAHPSISSSPTSAAPKLAIPIPPNRFPNWSAICCG